MSVVPATLHVTMSLQFLITSGMEFPANQLKAIFAAGRSIKVSLHSSHVMSIYVLHFLHGTPAMLLWKEYPGSKSHSARHMCR